MPLHAVTIRAMRDLVDIGLNLTHQSFDDDRDAVIAEAERSGVSRFILTGTSLTASAHALELAGTRPAVLFSTAGVHPHHAKDFDEHSAAALEPLLSDRSVVAVGECGLDFFRNFSSRKEQIRAFTDQLELAAAAKLPVFLHQREAHETFLEILRSRRNRLVGGVAHCFTGGLQELRAYLELDLHIGITGWLCDERRGQALREAVKSLPPDRLLVETDAPYLLPRDLDRKPRSRRNEPRYLPHIVMRLGELTGRDPGSLAAASTANAERLFRISQGGAPPAGPPVPRPP